PAAAPVLAGLAVCLLRRGLRGPGGARAPRFGRAARPFRAGTDLPAPRHEGDRVLPPLPPGEGRGEGRTFATTAGSRFSYSPPRAARGPLDARRGPRSARLRAGRSRRTRGPLLHGGRSGEVLPHDPLRRPPRPRPRSFARWRRGADAPALLWGRERTRPGLRHRDVLLAKPRRSLPARLFRPHGLYGHVALDRPLLGDLRRLSLQSGASRRQGR